MAWHSELTPGCTGRAEQADIPDSICFWWTPAKEPKHHTKRSHDAGFFPLELSWRYICGEVSWERVGLQLRSPIAIHKLRTIVFSQHIFIRKGA
jgi:hypothetical protein